MKIRIAILASCASALVMTASLAHAGDPIPGVDSKIGNKGYNGRSQMNLKGTALPGDRKIPVGGGAAVTLGSGFSQPSIADQGQGGVLTSYKNRK